MHYMTDYIWRGTKGENEQDSVLLQQIRYGKRNIAVICVCDAGKAGGYITGQLKIWFQRRGQELLCRKADENRIQKELNRELMRIRSDIRKYELKKQECFQVNLSGILIAGQECWLFWGGRGCCYVFNQKFQRTHRKKIGGHAGKMWQVREGRIQKDVGLLFATEHFNKRVSEEAMKQCLAAQDIVREEQIERRLNELWEAGCRQDGKDTCAAVYVKSVGRCLRPAGIVDLRRKQHG